VLESRRVPSAERHRKETLQAKYRNLRVHSVGSATGDKDSQQEDSKKTYNNLMRSNVARRNYNSNSSDGSAKSYRTSRLNKESLPIQEDL